MLALMGNPLLHTSSQFSTGLLSSNRQVHHWHDRYRDCILQDSNIRLVDCPHVKPPHSRYIPNAITSRRGWFLSPLRANVLLIQRGTSSHFEDASVLSLLSILVVGILLFFQLSPGSALSDVSEVGWNPAIAVVSGQLECKWLASESTLQFSVGTERISREPALFLPRVQLCRF